MAEYTKIDENQNTTRVELSEEPVIVARRYVVGKYLVGFTGRTNAEALAALEQWAAVRTPYRGFAMVAKHLGWYDIFIDDKGRQFLHGFYDGNGKFKFAHDGIV